MRKKCSIERPAAPIVTPRKDVSCCCNFPTLVILILIVLQFSRSTDSCDGDSDSKDRSFPVGNGILFIIALFFLACCNSCMTDDPVGDPPFRNRFDFDRFRRFDFDFDRFRRFDFDRFRRFDFDFDRDRDRDRDRFRFR